MNTTPLGKHPNAALSVGTGGAGVLIIWLLGHTGVSMPNEVAVLVAAAITSVALLVGRKGVRGVIRLVWHGSDDEG